MPRPPERRTPMRLEFVPMRFESDRSLAFRSWRKAFGAVPVCLSYVRAASECGAPLFFVRGLLVPGDDLLLQLVPYFFVVAEGFGVDVASAKGTKI